MPSQHGSSAHSSNVPQSHSSSSSMTLLPQLRRNSICERGQKQTKRSASGRIYKGGGGKASRGIRKSLICRTGQNKIPAKFSAVAKPNESLFGLALSPYRFVGRWAGCRQEIVQSVPGKGKEEGEGAWGEGDFAASLTSLGLLSKQSPWPVRSASI